MNTINSNIFKSISNAPITICDIQRILWITFFLKKTLLHKLKDSTITGLDN